MQINTNDCVITLLPIGDENEDTIAWDCYVTHAPSKADGQATGESKESAEMLGIQSVMGTKMFKEWHDKTYGEHVPKSLEHKDLRLVNVNLGNKSFSVFVPKTVISSDKPTLTKAAQRTMVAAAKDAISNMVVEETICETKEKKYYSFKDCRVTSFVYENKCYLVKE